MVLSESAANAEIDALNTRYSGSARSRALRVAGSQRPHRWLPACWHFTAHWREPIPVGGTMPRLNLYEQQTSAQGPRASAADFGAARRRP